MAKNLDTFQPMDPDMKVKWLEALRSGNYVQGINRLQWTDGCNCCLGVLAHVNKVRYITRGSSNVFFFDTDKGEFGSPCCPPDDWCGITNAALMRLINMNDDEGKSFEEIADWIEENL